MTNRSNIIGVSLSLRSGNGKNVLAKEIRMNGWFKEKADLNFHASLKRVHLFVEKYDIEIPMMQIRTMKVRWGSCIKDKKKYYA